MSTIFPMLLIRAHKRGILNPGPGAKEGSWKFPGILYIPISPRLAACMTCQVHDYGHTVAAAASHMCQAEECILDTP